MATIGRMAIFLAGLCFLDGAFGAAPQYTAEGQLQFPADYREWVFLSSGSGMTYGPLAAAGQQGPPLFDNVFVNRESYRGFLETGHWPDKTVFVLEVRSSEGHASINNGGHFQRDIVGIEAEVKDTSSAQGTWTFYGFPLNSGKPSAPAKAFPRTASCYSCHGTNTAVENTFVQFYPELYDVAQRKGTLKPDFEKLPLTTGGLLELVRTSGWAPAEKALAETVRRAPDAAVLSERSLNSAGYGLLQSKPSDAVALLEWTAVRYPQSSNAQDSLADAYLAAGNKDASRRATDKALQLAASDPSLSAEARARLAQSAKNRLERLK
jgi:hypothetical protein